MPDTAKQYGLKNPNDLNESAEAAARMMKDLMKSNGGDLNKSLAAYNWGQGNLNKYGLDHAPAETRNYLREVEGRMANSGTTNSSEVHIHGPITFTTQATNGKELARDFKENMMDAGRLANQANSAVY